MTADHMETHTVIERNQYAASKEKNNIIEVELKEFLGVMFFCGHHILPREKMYWEN